MNETDLKLLLADLAIEARSARLQLAHARARIVELEAAALPAAMPAPEPSETATFDEHGQATP